ncbi:MAG: toxin co-regulated pilus biosynthesis Q family protein [Candidatus Symbiodolus clandestinus]
MRIPMVKVLMAMVLCLLLSTPLPASDFSCSPQPVSSAELKEPAFEEAYRAVALAREAYEAAQRVLRQPLVNQAKKPPKAIYELINPKKVWCAKAGGTLQESLVVWAKTAGWLLQWHSDYDYPILADICFTGTFEKAMEEVVDAYKEAEHPLYLDIYPQQQLTVVTH